MGHQQTVQPAMAGIPNKEMMRTAQNRGRENRQMFFPATFASIFPDRTRSRNKRIYEERPKADGNCSPRKQRRRSLGSNEPDKAVGSESQRPMVLSPAE